MVSLIVHADDFGLSEKVNEGIIRAHIDGILTSTSIIACGNAFDQAVDLSKANPSLDLGIHLTLIEERPLLSPVDIPSLVLENGYFHPHAKNFLKKYVLNKISITDIEREFNAQFEKVFDYGLPISHIDSHQHIHILPKVFEITSGLAEKYRIKQVRIPNERFRLYMFKRISSYPRVLQSLILKTIISFVDNDLIHSMPQFWGFFYGGRLNRYNLNTVIDNLPKNGVSEIMCHPGLKDSGSPYLHWEYNWNDELEALTDAKIRSLITRKGISLMSYREM